MKIDLTEGTYILAISGGVDSMVMLDIIAKSYLNKKNYKFIVGHFDHGIRNDSNLDSELVYKICNKLGIDFESEKANLGPKASESLARQKRYDFLFNIRKKHKAKALITAHHKDDVIETAVFNLLRGTGRKGLTTLNRNSEIIRPMVGYDKQTIIEYALKNNLIWREDSTNQNLKYSRNLIRLQKLKNLTKDQQAKLVKIINRQEEVNNELDKLMKSLLEKFGHETKINRKFLNNLPDKISAELIAEWLRRNNLRDFDRKTIERIQKGSKIGITGSQYDIKHNYYVNVTRDYLALNVRER